MFPHTLLTYCIPRVSFIRREINMLLSCRRYKLGLYILLSIPWNMMNAQPYISLDTPPSCYEIEARVRNGISGYEGTIFTPSTPNHLLPVKIKWQLNPSGLPVWNSNGNRYGDVHSFLYTYTPATGTSVWNIDFNRDGDYSDPQESVTNVAPTLTGRGFQYISILGQGDKYGRTATLTHFTINGVDFGTYTSNTNTPFSILFEDLMGLFNEVTISGQFSFSGNGIQERPRIWVRLGESNTSPTCILTSPMEGSVYSVGSNIFLAATATDHGKVIKVEFYDGDHKIGEDLDFPYTLTWSNSPPGFRHLRAKAIDNHQAFAWSNQITIVVNDAPSSFIIKPIDGSVFHDPDTIHIQAEVVDVNDSTNVVEFFLDDMSIGTDNSPPYTNSALLNLAMGNYVLKVKSTDPYGALSFSPPVHITLRCIREDLDNDGAVNTQDFLSVLYDFGENCNGCGPDLTDDGIVNTMDLLRLLGKFGYTCN